MGPEHTAVAPSSASLLCRHRQIAEQTLDLVLSSVKWDNNSSLARLWCGVNGLAMEGAGLRVLGDSSSLSLWPSLARF